jgi:hypothetical protein
VLNAAGPEIAKACEHKVTVEGHTDGIGSDAYNDKLSEARQNRARLAGCEQFHSGGQRHQRLWQETARDVHHDAGRQGRSAGAPEEPAGRDRRQYL